MVRGLRPAAQRRELVADIACPKQSEVVSISFKIKEASPEQSILELSSILVTFLRRSIEDNPTELSTDDEVRSSSGIYR
jgi:hypothetical protein